MANFSQDGSKYVIVEGKLISGPVEVHLYDFDRCTGLLSNPQYWTIPISPIFAEGCAISPNSRYLYASAYTELWQYDLWADDVEASGILVGEYDGFLVHNFFTTHFYQAELAPDGKIYITCTNGVRYMHVIHNPDEAGLACNFEQRGLYLPTHNSFAAPNWPNYRLGPLDGSPCDTLGLDNLPLARFRIDTTASVTTYGFHDLSDYEPTEWSWSFGDGGTSTERHPTHTFPDEAPYEVCLTVSNPYGSDTKCRGVNGFIVSTGELLPYANGLLLYPNPARDVVQLRFERTLPKNGHFELYDALGRRVLARPLPVGHDAFTLPLRGVSGGVYFYRVAAAGVLLDSGRLVVE